MKNFTMDNTEGYTQEQLDRLNELYEKRVERYEMRHECDIDDEERQHISEDVQSHYDYCIKCNKRLLRYIHKSSWID